MNVELKNQYQSESKPSFLSTVVSKIGIGFVVFFLLMGLFAKLAEEMHEGDTLGVDQTILYSVHSLHGTLLDQIVPLITNLGGVVGVIGIIGIASAALATKRKYLALLQMLVGVGGAVLLNMLVKGFFARQRPDLWERLVTETSYSFPSGHSMASAALALSVVLITWNTRFRWWVVAAASLYVVTIGFTRLYLGVHYPTDVLAGWSLGAAWVLFVAWLIGGISRRNKKGKNEDYPS
jgi:undecaprenyl-diphosphatase